jgi:hypothetical protein
MEIFVEMDNASRDKIISDLYLRADIDKLCGRKGKNWADQLKSEAFLMLCELSTDEFNKLVEENRVKGWLITTINNISGTNSDFSRFIKGKPKGVEFYSLEEVTEMPDINDNADNDNESNEDPINDYCEADLLQGLKILDFFHKDVMTKYLQYGNNIRKTARVMGINREYVGKLVKESKQQIEIYLNSKNSGK